MKIAWRRIIPPLLCGALVLVAGSVRAAVVQPRAAESGSVIVTASSAEVREGPSRRAEVITVVEKGEVFAKLGRTGGWYYIQISDDTFGWISGRAIKRYTAAVAPAPDLGPYDSRYYPYYPGGYYGYSYWGPPSLSWEWYYYGRDRDWYRDRHRDRDRDKDNHKDWDHRQPPVDDGRADGDQLHNNPRYRDDRPDWSDDSHRGAGSGPRSTPEPRSSGSRLRPPFNRR